MLIRKIFAFLCVWVLAFSAVNVQAEDASVWPEGLPKKVKYTGGVVMRTLPRGGASDPIEVAYSLTDMPYIILGEKTNWDMFVSGGQAPYTTTVIVFHQESLEMDEFADYWMGIDFFETKESSFDYTFTLPGRYFIQLNIEDGQGQTLQYQTRMYEAYNTEDEANEKTVVGKVNSLLETLIDDGMSDYTRALVLHDWLIENAEYDLTYTHYDAAGVLLKGTGVCDSYARAYLMLCTAAGLECMYVPGTAGTSPDKSQWENHAWNLVKLGDNWYHVDCTWDDPVPDGGENHQYFCVDDETMARDHRWNRPGDQFYSEGMLVPDAEGGEYQQAIQGADANFTFADLADYRQQFEKMYQAGERWNEVIGDYTGGYLTQEMISAWEAWLMDMVGELCSRNEMDCSYGYWYDQDTLAFQVTWLDPVQYVRIDATNVLLTLSESCTIVPDGYLPGAVCTWESSNPEVAEVVNTGTAGTVSAQIRALSYGDATITVTTADGISDSVTVHVLAPHQPDFELQAKKSQDGLTLSWKRVPGVTEYRVMRSVNGQETCLQVTAEETVFLTGQQVPANVEQELYILGLRMVGDKEMFRYASEGLLYGVPAIEYTARIPAEAVRIDAEAFYGNITLKNMYIGDQVETIGDRAFAGCTAMTAVRIPSSVTSIGEDAFSHCPLAYVQVETGSYAARWMAEHFPTARQLTEP